MMLMICSCWEVDEEAIKTETSSMYLMMRRRQWCWDVSV